MTRPDWPSIDFAQRWSDPEALAAAYVRDYEWSQRHPWSPTDDAVDPDDRGPDAWARDEMLERITFAPDADRDWPLIVALSRACDTLSQRYYVAAGPVEDYIAGHGDSVIERVEGRAATDARFRFILGGVWQAGMSPGLYLRVLRASGATVDQPAYMAYQRRRRLMLPLHVARFIGWLAGEATKASLRAVSRRLRGSTASHHATTSSDPNPCVDISVGEADVEVSQDGVLLATGVHPVATATMHDASVEVWVTLGAGWRLCITSHGSAEETTLLLESPDGPVAIATPADGLEVHELRQSATSFRCELVATALRPFASDLDSHAYAAHVRLSQGDVTRISA